MSWMFAKGTGDQRSIPGRIIPKIQKTVLNTALINTQLYKIGIKSEAIKAIE